MNPRSTPTKPQNRTLLGKGLALNANSTAAQAISIGASKYIIRRIVAAGASVSLTTAVGEVYTDSGATSPATSGLVQSSLDATAKFKDGTLQAAVTGSYLTESSLYFKCSVAQGSAATVDVYIYGDILE